VVVMRERRPSDWKYDFAARHPLESAVEAALDEAAGLTRLGSSTNAMNRLDFSVLGPGERLCQIELKAKRQPYRGRSDLRPEVNEADLFILDELALRKICERSVRSAICAH
jgi:hypothetical protein